MDKKTAFFVAVTIVILVQLLTYKSVEGYTDNNMTQACLRPVLNADDFNVYLINLDRNKNRLERFVKQYTNSDLNFKTVQRIAAVDGKNLNITQYLSDRAFKEIKNIETTGYRTKHYQLSRGAVGCYLSHLKAYKYISESDKPYGIIFEDDVNISRDFYYKLNIILSKIPNNWDVLLLGCHCLKCKKHDVYSDVSKFILLHCYIVKKEAAKFLFDTLNKKPIEQQIDSEISDFIINTNKINMYCVNDALSWQNNSFSTEIQIPIRSVSGVNPYEPVTSK